MDIVAHTLWAGIGVSIVRRYRPVPNKVVAGTLFMAAVPDILHLTPMLAWWLFGGGTFAALKAYAVALPGQEPAVPHLVHLLSHHLHCVMHSAPIALVVSIAVWRFKRSLWIPILGWWSHIIIDVFTHSAKYYPVPVLYPFTYRGFDGIAWNTHWFMVLNYLSIGLVGIWLVLTRKRPHIS